MNCLILRNRNYSTILTLILKELRISPYINLLILAVPTIFIASGFLLSVEYFEGFEVRDCTYLITRIGIFIPLFFGEFIIAREYKKGTYVLMRSMPISDEILYFSKNSFGFFILFVSEIPGFILLYLYFDNVPVFLYPLIIVCLLLFTTTLTLLLTLKFGLRVTFLMINITIEISIYLWKEFEDLYPESANYVSQSDLLYILASVLLLIGTYIFYRLGVRHFLMRDTRELIA